MRQTIDNLRIAGCAMRYSQFVPRLYNYCLSLGFDRNRMMPSRAFCSDESQGYPVILLAQHFGTFPFDHGRVGGKVAVNRHGPHAHHGEDLVIVQASHVGYDAQTRRFGVYRRHRTHGRGFGDNCGKICGVLHWYMQEYRYAAEQVLCGALDGAPVVLIDNLLLDAARPEGLVLKLENLVDRADGPLRAMSTCKAFRPAASLLARLGPECWLQPPAALGDRLTSDLFTFRRMPAQDIEHYDQIEVALGPVMPALVTSPDPALDAARFHTQVEFDRTYRSIVREPAYRDKNLLFVAGLNIDVSPGEGMPFPLTKFVPWAAYVSLRDGRRSLLEQDELVATLRAQSADNSDRLSFDEVIADMSEVDEIIFDARLG
ncbi:hypothetical protein JQ557_28670 [Bradyrhizobium sp. U87765 SZCCT0131]|uniref:hypothetical protein n=1 Tax=unclassified Bradyrhizobium TaxID=2631580 RepID=UPI001BA89D13|nr:MULTISPECIES: hypothetical protein [unclassified Bradyrhizobium]MBR1222007.1 hypothetical protein [Bradyrhizobium sp. U87765 SZCCT0131]MBR1263795.1 hypothetical protein [Bradyrhizobium sp. U87765 SZCCT0134]MBR1302635.1 hypothetical protein [Bradyrhizobium sp. U87765 SZCCT0110]MBR1320045.1 hypothetical protein [Bradyrhizobium sp. U87765 SZCCT0109]MBR1348842.1 hypothetical protein [Bradyrhizobium sp. U87765 SZCCT0048]